MKYCLWGVLVWLASGMIPVIAEEPQETTDWPTMISRLRQQMYDRPGHAHTRQQLAIAYNNYAVTLGEEGKWREAISQLEEAIRLDDANPQFKVNMGSMHLNQAKEAFEAHRLRDAKAEVQEALSFNPEAAGAYRLLGEAEYASQQLKEAKTAWQRSLELDANQADVAERLRQVTQELPVESKFERLTHVYFDLRYEDEVERPTGFDIRDALLQARREVGSDFAYWPSHKLIVLLYSAESFRMLREHTPDWVAGQFDGKIRVPLPGGQLDPAMVRQILFHEYTHALIHDLTAGTCPIWLNEGLAEYEGATQRATPPLQLAAAHAQERLVPWAQLSDQFSAMRSTDEVALGYQQAHSIAAYLIQRYGVWRIRRLLKALAEGQAWESAMADEFRRKLVRLEADWQEWLPEFLH